jgi:hypothetical protein
LCTVSVDPEVDAHGIERQRTPDEMRAHPFRPLGIENGRAGMRDRECSDACILTGRSASTIHSTVIL